MKVENIDIIFVLIISVIFFGGAFNLIGFNCLTLITIIVLISSNKQTVAVFLGWIFLKSSVMWEEIYGFPKLGLLGLILSFCLIFSNKVNQKINLKKSITLITPLIFLFCFYYLIGPMHSYSSEKLLYIIFHSIVYLIIFLVLFLNPKINITKMIILFLCVGFQYYIFVSLMTGWEGVIDLTEFGSLRNFYKVNFKELDGEMVINYQIVGLIGLICFSFLMFFNKNKLKISKSNLFYLISIILAFAVVIYSGSRQSIYSLPIIILISIYLNRRINIFKKLLIVFTFIFLATNFIIPQIDNDSNILISEGTTYIENINRPVETLKAIDMIQDKLYFGHGLGGFSDNGERYYPHNLILELLVEVGFIGFLLIVIYYMILAKKNELNFRQTTFNGHYIIIVFLPILVRSFISSDLSENVIVFSFITAWILIKKIKTNSLHNNI